jgi:hypothetical protein
MIEAGTSPFVKAFNYQSQQALETVDYIIIKIVSVSPLRVVSLEKKFG